MKHDEELKDPFKIGFAMMLSTLHTILAIVVAIAIFFLGLVTCGYFWPAELKEYLFFVGHTEDEKPGEVKKIHELVFSFKQQNIELRDELKNDLNQQGAELKQMSAMLEQIAGRLDEMNARLNQS